MEEKLEVWFRKQGRLVIAALPKMRNRFAESAATDFDALFDKAVEVIVLEGEDIVEQGLASAYVDGFQGMGAEMKAAQGIQASFEIDQPRAIRWAKEQAAKDVADINDTTKNHIKNLVVHGIEEGESYDSVARSITNQFEEFAVGKPQAHIQSRAHLIAVNENAVAYEEGRHDVINELKDMGLDMEKSRIGPRDDRTSEGCLDDLAVEWIPEDEAFPSGIMYGPRFPGCRHDTGYRVSRAGEEA